MDARSFPALAVGTGITAGALLWWLLRGKTGQAKPKPSSLPSDYIIPVAKVTKLYIYPVKSCRGIEMGSVECLKRGLEYDRSWVVMDRNGSFCNQRKMPTMALIKQTLTFSREGEVTLTLDAPRMPTLILKEPRHDADTSVVKVWNISGEGVDMGEEASRWFSQYLETDDCRMYYMAAHHKSRVLVTDPQWIEFTDPEDETSFADWAPVLVLSESSLELLNSKLDTPVPIERFRPNIVVSNSLPHAEDNWNGVKIGPQLILRSLKACGRCKMTTVDPDKGCFVGIEPLETLRTYRRYETVYNCKADSRFGASPLFGFNFTVLHTGRVSVGDTVFSS